MAGEVDAHYGRGDLRGAIAAALQEAGKDVGRLTLEDLAPLEEFHTLGRRATLALAELAGLRSGAAVVDAGAGLGGPARLLAERYGCRVTAVDLTAEYCEIARWLNDATGLTHRIEVIQGDVLSLPLGDASVDVVWTQHVQMNIADKHAFYREARRVLAPGGTLALWDVIAGPEQPIHFPVPWAESAEISHLADEETLRDAVTASDFEVEHWNDLTGDALAFFRSAGAAPPRLGLGVFVPDFPRKAQNMARNIEERRVRLLQAVLVAR